MMRLACSILCRLAAADEPLTAPAVPGDPADFADTLREAGDPYNALTWYRYALWLDPARPDAAALGFRAAWCYESGGRWQEAELAYGELATRYPQLGPAAAWRQAVVLAHGQELHAADAALTELQLLYPDSPWAPQAEYTRGVLHLEAQDLPGAAGAFAAAAAQGGPLASRAASLAMSAEARLPRRSPAVAAGASLLVPGLGQAYAGHWGDAGMALAANGALALLAGSLLRYAVEEDRAWAAGAGAVVAGGLALTWSSNVLGAWRGAERFNSHTQRRAAEELLELAWEPGLEVRADEVALPARALPAEGAPRPDAPPTPAQ